MDGQASNALIRCSTDQLIGADNARSIGCSRSALAARIGAPILGYGLVVDLGNVEDGDAGVDRHDDQAGRDR